MALWPVTLEDGSVENVEAPAKPSNEEAASLVAAKRAQAPPVSAPASGSWLPDVGEVVGSAGGAMLGGPVGAGLGATALRTAGSVAAGEGVPSPTSLLTTFGVNATGEKVGQLALKGVSKLVSPRAFQEGASSIMDLLRSKVGTDPIGAGKLMRHVIEGPAMRRVSMKTTRLYKNLTDAATREGIRINNPTKVVDMAKDMVTSLESTEHVFPEQAKETIKLLKKVANFANKTPGFTEYWGMYRDLQASFKSYAKLAQSPLLEDRVQKALLMQVNADLNASIKGTALEALRTTADAHFSAVDKPFEKLVTKKLFGSYEEPDLMIRYLTEPGHASRFMAWAKVATKKEKEVLREAWMRDVIRESTDPVTSAISGGKFGAAWHGLDDTTRDALFDGTQHEYKKIFDTLGSEILREKNLGQAGGSIRGFGPSILMVHAAYSFTRGDVQEGLQSVAAAGGLASLLSSPRVARLLVKGLSVSPKSKAAIRVGQHITSAIVSTAADQLVAQPAVDTSAQQGAQGALAY